jgi:DNA-binding GntR family transcriptional regulator
LESPLSVPADTAVRHRTMAEAALERLREAIIMGELTPGTPLRLEDLARQLGMSISPIREAVRQLEALGLAEHVPHHGAKVMALDVEELRELFAIRLVLEGMAVRRAAELLEPGDVERARKHLTAYDEARRRGDIRAAVRAHGAFHFALYDAARSAWLLRLIRPAWDSCVR